MDNFRRSRRTNTSGKLDGIVQNRMRRRPNIGSTNRTPGLPTASTQSKVAESRVGNFERKEGFLPRKTKEIMPDGRGLGRKPRPVQPIDMKLDESKNSKRKTGKKRPGLKKTLLRAGAAFMVLTLLIGGYIAFKGYLRARQVFQGGGEALAWNCEPDPAVLKGEGDGRVNILLLGKGGPEQTDGPDLTDTIILASVDPCNKDAGLLSIPRDLAVKMESGESAKINAVYALTKMSAESRGSSEKEADKQGIKAIEKVVENVTGVPIHYYTMVDFTAFEKAVDAVGGVEVNVKKPVYEQMLLKGKPYTLNVDTGPQKFDGLKALAYSRSRYTSQRGDFDRSERQREIIIALREKVFSLGTFSNPVKVSQLMDSFGSRVSTNLSIPDDVSKLYTLGQEIDASKITSLSLVDKPNVLVAGGSDFTLGSIQVPTAGIFNYEAIQTFVRTKLKDGFIRKENPNVVVLNGTAVGGLATQKADVLKGFGYNVSKVDDAPDKNTTNTILIDLTKDKKYTKRYMELRYKTTAVSQLPAGITVPEGVNFVIILGQNETVN